MKIVFFGTPEFSLPTLTKILAQPDWQVVGVVTQPDRKRGRGNHLLPSPVKALALEHQLPIQQPERIKKSPETIQWLRELGADVFVVIAYGQILSAEILEIPPLGCINVHGSLLPAYRGAAPIQRCLVAGATSTGITTMQMDIGMDTGAMLLKASMEIPPLMNARELGSQLAELGANLLVDTLRQRPAPVPQEDRAATYAAMVSKADWQIDWHRRAIDLHNQIRGFYPDCYGTMGEQPIKILATVPLETPYWSESIPRDLPTAVPGTIVRILKGKGPIVACGEGHLLLALVQPPGKKPQSGADFVNGSRLTVGTSFSIADRV
jgi:methionyl-tRNA formyltransferase